jgi:hypothetical protein
MRVAILFALSCCAVGCSKAQPGHPQTWTSPLPSPQYPTSTQAAPTPDLVMASIQVAASPARSTKERASAIYAIVGKAREHHIPSLMSLFASDAPGEVLDAIGRVLSAMPYDQVEPHVFALFSRVDWKRRRLAVASLLKTARGEHASRFMDALDTVPMPNFEIREALTYGAYVGDLGPEVRPLIVQHLGAGSVPARVTAIGYFYSHGTKDDVAMLAAYADDATPIPPCDPSAQCDWYCVSEPSKPHSITTVGEVVQYCVLPRLQRTNQP